mmetsp:Transcript_34358/g.47866  ORF Transcript_34358/g.47866 Transcript_34358/m.47866 type:complete len:93 (+) Transcript_34358:374-652(+)
MFEAVRITKKYGHDSFCETRTWMQQLRNMRRIDNRKNVNARTLHGKVPVILVGTKSDKRLDAMDRTHKGIGRANLNISTQLCFFLKQQRHIK